MPDRFIPPYENSNWPRWVEILNKKISDAADFDEVMTLLHGDRYPKQSFSNFLFDYFANSEDESSLILINPQPNKKIDKRQLFDVIIPFIQKMATQCPEIFYGYLLSNMGISIRTMNNMPQNEIIEKLISRGVIYPLSLSGRDKNIMIPRVYIISILACAFFGIFDLYDPHEVISSSPSELHNKFSVIGIVKAVTENRSAVIFDCVINYFNRVRRAVPSGNLIISRIKHISPGETDAAIWSKNSPISRVRLYTNIMAERSLSHVQLIPSVGKLGISPKNIEKEIPTSEQINYLLQPELLAVSIFTEDLSANESLAVLGTEIYSSLTYSEISPGNHALRFSGEYFDNIHRVKNGTPARTMIFVRSHGAKGIDSEFLDSFKSDVGILFSSIYSAVPKNMNHAAGGIRIDISVGPLTEPAGQSNSSSISSLQEIRFLKLLIASSSAGSNRINYHRLNTLELDLNTQNSTINSIEDFMNFLAKKNVGTSALIKAYSSLMADITRDKNNSYGEYDLRKISAFEEIKKRI